MTTKGWREIGASHQLSPEWRLRKSKRRHFPDIDTAVSDVGQETTSSGAGHTGGNLDDDEIEGIERLQTAFEEIKSHITKAWNDAILMLVDELAFTEINTLMTVAREAADSHRNFRKVCQGGKAKTPHNLDAQGHQTPQCVAPIHLLGGKRVRGGT
jgi:hypothetical protein